MPTTSNPDSFAALPKDRPPFSSTGQRGDVPFNWGDLVPFFIHPIKVAVIEALLWIEHPLSPAELERVFHETDYSLGVIAYHVKELEKRGAIVLSSERQVRGARESFYFFSNSTAER